MLDTKKIVTKETEDTFVEEVIRFAKEHSMTISNIEKGIEKVVKYFNDNAVMEKEVDADAPTS